jgi:hypothetical protein
MYFFCQILIIYWYVLTVSSSIRSNSCPLGLDETQFGLPEDKIETQRASTELTLHSSFHPSMVPGRSLRAGDRDGTVPRRPAAAGITRDGVTTSTTERLYESVPRRLCAHPFRPEKPSAMTQQFLNPTLLSVLATIFELSLYLQVHSHHARASEKGLCFHLNQDKAEEEAIGKEMAVRGTDESMTITLEPLPILLR